jgi:hypothetical protein
MCWFYIRAAVNAALFYFYFKNVVMKNKVVFLLLFPLSGFAQSAAMPGNLPSGSIRNIVIANPTYNNGTYIAEKQKGYEGSVFLFDEYRPGLVLLKNGESYDSLQLKYDAEKNILLVKLEDKEYQFTADVKEFAIYSPENQPLIFRHYPGPKEKGGEKIFYEVLKDGHYQLLKLTKKQWVTESTNVPGLKTKKIEEELTYFIRMPDSILHRIKKHTEKEVLNVLRLKTEALKAFIKSNNLNLAVDKDIIAVIGYYEGLVKDN